MKPEFLFDEVGVSGDKVVLAVLHGVQNAVKLEFFGDFLCG